MVSFKSVCSLAFVVAILMEAYLQSKMLSSALCSYIRTYIKMAYTCISPIRGITSLFKPNPKNRRQKHYAPH